MDTKVLHSLSYGLYIVASVNKEKINAQIVNSAFQITSEPIRIAISLNKHNLTHEYVEKSNLFSISILEKETPMQFIGTLGFRSGRDIDKFKGANYKTVDNGLPVVMDYSLGYIAAKVINKMDIGTHTIFVGEMFDGEILKRGEPMTYAYYHEVKKGKSPKTAPTYIKD